MDNEDQNVLLLDIAERQKAIAANVKELIVGLNAATEKYAATDAVYREELDRYRKTNDAFSLGGKIVLAIRLLGLVLLAFIAYTVAR